MWVLLAVLIVGGLGMRGVPEVLRCIELGRGMSPLSGVVSSGCLNEQGCLT